MIKIYLETTVFNYYYLDDPKRTHEIEITRLLFKEIGARQNLKELFQI